MEPKEIEFEKKDKLDTENEHLDKNFKLGKLAILDLYTSYEQRKIEEDLVFINELGGDTGIAEKINSSIVNGIRDDPEEKANRIKSFDSNAIEVDEVPNCCYFVWDILKDLMLRILIVAAIVQISLGASPLSEDPSKDWVDGLSIILAVVVVVLVGSITNYTKEKKFKQLSDTNSNMIKFVITRDGHTKEVGAGELLVGDLVNISTGKILPSDGMLVQGHEIKIDESPLTGESDLIVKETFKKCLEIKETMILKGKKINNKHSLPSPIMFSGTLVKQGEGKMLVLRVGKNSAKGKIQESVIQSQESDDSKTPLEEKLDVIAAQIGYFGMAAAVVTLVALMIRFGIKYPNDSDSYELEMQNKENATKLYEADPQRYENDTEFLDIVNSTPINPKKNISSDILKIILLCIAIIVVAIPEGLPLAVTLSLAFSINKMMKENNLVRKMHACETMGGANYICSDKTGTLTKNIMSVNSLFNGKSTLNLEEDTKNVSTIVDPAKYFPNKDYYTLFKLSVSLNVDAEINSNEEVKEASKTDQAFIDLMHIFGERIYDIRKVYYPTDLNDIRKFPFSSDRKRMSVFIKNEEFPTGYRMFIKGASEILLNWSTHFINPETNEKRIMSDVDFKLFEGIIHNFACNSLRTILLCYKDITAEQFENYQDTDQTNDYIIEKSDLCVVGIAGIRDTLRPGVKESVVKCNNAGITVIMVTGDNKETAIAIAKDCNIISPEIVSKYNDFEKTHIAMSGDEFYRYIGGLECETCSEDTLKCKCPTTKKQAKLAKKDEDKIKKERIKSMDKFKEIVKDLRVLARSRPMDKYALVLGLRALNNVVAVTGDGTNDAPALSKSDVGFAMGIQGTDIAKDASDIIIMDDNFSSIVIAVLWGRNIFDSIRKFIQFQLTVNICACFLVFITACIGNETPLTAIQMLWVNLIMDSLGSLALATEPPHESLLNRKPYRRNDSIISPRMWKHILVQAFVQLGILLFLYLHAPYFIMETDTNRIAQTDLIYRCYGVVPGNVPVDGQYYILNGSSNFWSPKDKIKYSIAETCGIYASKHDMHMAFLTYEKNFGNTSHMTIVFNTFVFYTLFNQINARVLDDSYNIFYRIHKNFIFIIIIFVECGLQAILVHFGQQGFHTSKDGLTGEQWGICLGFASVTFLVSAVIKPIPMERCIEKLLNKCRKKHTEDEFNNDNEINKIHQKENDQLNPHENKMNSKQLSKKQDSKQKSFKDMVRKPSKMLTSRNPSIQQMRDKKE